jgi:hypothetical protein
MAESNDSSGGVKRKKRRSGVNLYNLEDEMAKPLDLHRIIMALHVAAW